MSPDLLLFAVGGLLLVTGLLGGGFELRELKIPKVGRVARVLATGAGGVCILLGLGLSAGLAPPPQPGPGAPPGATQTVDAQTDGPIRFVVRDELGLNQVSEQVSLVLDGRRVGELTVNSEYPESTLELSVDDPGRHDYTVSASSVEVDEDGNAVYRDGSGQGSLIPEAGASYHVEYAEGGNGRDLTLVAD
jgi:hypothetical protein